MGLTIIPSIDLRAGRVVRLKQGDYDRQVNYDVDPMAVARGFADAGAEWMHVVDLDGAREGRPAQTPLIQSIISSTGLKVEVGGGIRSTQDVQTLLDAGAQRVVIGTRAMEDWDWFKALVHTPGFERRLILAVDARDGVIATRGWTAASTRSAADVAAEVSDWPVAALLYTDVAKDGMLSGPNVAHTALLVSAGKVPVIASGGVGSLNHLRDLLGKGIWAAIVGRSLYEGKVDLREAIAVGREE